MSQPRSRAGRIRRLRPFLLAAVISAFAGMAFPFIQGVIGFKVILGGAILGTCVSLFLSLFEVFIYERRLRKMSVKKAIAVKSLVYAVTISVCYLAMSLALQQELSSRGRILTFQSVFTFSLVASLIISSFVTISRILGQNELILLVLGRYHKPREEERVVMFVDMVRSTAIAENIGSVRFLSLLNDFFYDLTIPILDTGGEIYKYVGDEVIITWKLKPGLRAGHCVECFFKMQEQLAENQAHYLEKYQLVPEFRAGLHSGTVVIGEMGDFKKEIAILGDTVNTAARIIQEAAAQGKPLLVSDALRQSLEKPARGRFRFEGIGAIHLRGKEKDMPLFTAERAVAPVHRLRGLAFWKKAA